MAPGRTSNPIPACLMFLAFVAIPLWLALLDLRFLEWVRLTPGDLFVAVVELELFFILGVWPLFLFRPPPFRETEGRISVPLLLQAIGLVLLGFPLAILCAWVGDVEWVSWTSRQGMVLVLSIWVAVFSGVAVRRRWRIRAGYFSGFFLLSAGIPFLAFLVREHEGSMPGFCSILSPFWAAAVPERSWVAALVFGGMALLMSVADGWVSRRDSLDRLSRSG